MGSATSREAGAFKTQSGEATGDMGGEAPEAKSAASSASVQGEGGRSASEVKDGAALVVPKDADGEAPTTEARVTTISDLEDKNLLMIFRLGAGSVWCAKEDGDGAIDEEDDGDEMDVSDGGDASATSKGNDEVLQLIDCARVCKRWYKLATTQSVWEELPGYPRFEKQAAQLDPLLLGCKWNAHLREVSAIIPCCELQMGQNVKRIEAAAAQKRANFTLRPSPTDCADRSVHAGWQKIRPLLHAHALRLKIVGFPIGRGISLYHFLGKPWKRLSQLEIDQCEWTIFPEHVFEDCLQWWRDVEKGSATPPLPAVRRLTLTGHAHAYIGSDVVQMVPGLERLVVHVERHRRCRMTSKKGKDRIGIVFSALLMTKKFRVYTTLPLVVAVKMPGPGDFCRDECWFGVEEMAVEYREKKNRIVAVAEVSKDGVLLSADVPLDEFVEMGNADEIALQARRPEVTLVPDEHEQNDYLSEKFTAMQHYVRQLISYEPPADESDCFSQSN